MTADDLASLEATASQLDRTALVMRRATASATHADIGTVEHAARVLRRIIDTERKP